MDTEKSYTDLAQPSTYK